MSESDLEIHAAEMVPLARDSAAVVAETGAAVGPAKAAGSRLGEPPTRASCVSCSLVSEVSVQMGHVSRPRYTVPAAHT